MTNMETLIIAIYNLAILGGTSYFVFGLGHSGWWFLLALMLMAGSSKT